ncbi:MAG TPA: Ig-like domain-containing protein [Gemmatimonadaceae bacterium]|nr:Ig-like domain-containing protein [Gemmatimonadaceae bacterium]
MSERPFSALSEAGWHDQSTPNFSIVQDAAAPRSASGVGEARFPAGFTGGNAPMTNYIDLPGGAQAIYLSFWLALSPNFQGHLSGGNKILYFTLGDRFRATFSAAGTGSAPLQPVIELRNIVRAPALRLVPNVGTGAVVRGQWQRWEIVLRSNTADNNDGTVDIWLNGTRLSSYSGIQFASATESHNWQSISWAPYWGSSGDRVVADQYMRMDHMYVSGGVPGATPPPPPPPPPAPSVYAVNVSAPRTTLLVGDGVQLAATAVDSAGNPVAGSTIAWASSDTTVASVSTSGYVAARRIGTATVSASSGGRSGSVVMTVSQVPVRRVTVTAPVSTLHPTQTTQLTATLADSAGNVLTGRAVAWSSSASGVATVSSSGLVTAVGTGNATITATSEGQSGSVSLVVSAVPVASIAVAPNSSSLLVGQGTQLVATVRDSAGNTLSGRTVTWSTANAGVASVSSAGYVTARAAGSTAVTATSEGRSASATITVSDPPVNPPPTGTNEPAGLTLISDRHFAAFNEAGWTDYYATNLSFVADPTAPQSQPTVGQVRYPAGFAGGTEPVNLYTQLGGRHTLYLAFWFKMSPNFYGHPNSSVNKLFHIWIGGSNRVTLAVMGSGTTPSFQPQVRLQQIPVSGGAINLPPNVVSSAQVVRDRWYKWELVLRANTPGVSDGSVEFWLDGAKIASYPNMQFVGAGQGNTWDTINWAPTWGGTGGVVPADQWMRMSEIYLSGQ